MGRIAAPHKCNQLYWLMIQIILELGIGIIGDFINLHGYKELYYPCIHACELINC